MRTKFSIVLLFALLFPMLVHAQVPETMSYQGRLTDGSDATVADGLYNLTFRLYEASTGGTVLWEELQSVSVFGGVFSVILGTSTPLNVSFGSPYWLGISVNGGTELAPRMALSSSPYSLNTRSIVDEAVTSASVADNSLTDTDISSSANISISKINGDPGVDFFELELLQGLPQSVTNLGQVQIDAPTSGYALLVLSGNAVLFGDNTVFTIGFGSSASAIDLIDARVGNLDGSATERYAESYAANIVVPVSAGSNTFYVNAEASTTFGSSTVNIADVVASVVFIAKSY